LQFLCDMTWKISLFIPRSRQFTVAKSSDYTRQKYLCEKDGKIHLLAARKTLKFYSFFAPKKRNHSNPKTHKIHANSIPRTEIRFLLCDFTAHLKRERDGKRSQINHPIPYLFSSNSNGKRRRDEKWNVNKSIDFEMKKINSATSFELSTVRDELKILHFSMWKTETGKLNAKSALD
jgi:hypothetical protein